MKWGAERMNIEIAKILDADIATAVWKSDCYDARAMGFVGDIFEVNPDFKKGMLGFLKMKWRFFRSWKLLRKYDSVFFSNEAISGIWSVKPGTKTYYYAHSISRHLFDLYDEYLAKVSWYARIPYVIAAYFFRKLYIAEVRKVDVIFVNSLRNKERMREWFGRDDAIVLYPPVDMDKFKIKNEKWKITVPDNLASWILHLESKGGYFLSFSRLTHAKRVDVIIEAFKNMPEKHLLVLYGEHDSQKDEFMKLAEWCDNITFLKLENNEDLPAVIRGATATIAISREEDFGMVAIESMACGVPVIAVDEGGYRETMLDGKTGRLVHSAQYTVHSMETMEQRKKIETALTEIVRNTKTEEWEAMKEDCIARASEFSIEKFKQQLKSYF